MLGSAIGAAISIWMPMTAIPQRTAISHAFGALAATLVGIAHYHFMTVSCRPSIAETACSTRRRWRSALWASR